MRLVFGLEHVTAVEAADGHVHLRQEGKRGEHVHQENVLRREGVGWLGWLAGWWLVSTAWAVGGVAD